jgi:hypothetical protein
LCVQVTCCGASTNFASPVSGEESANAMTCRSTKPGIPILRVCYPLGSCGGEWRATTYSKTSSSRKKEENENRGSVEFFGVRFHNSLVSRPFHTCVALSSLMIKVVHGPPACRLPGHPSVLMHICRDRQHNPLKIACSRLLLAGNKNTISHRS